jgi:hypothetical protein
VARKREIIKEHQEKCQKPTWAEEIRTIMQQKEGFAVVSSNSHKKELAGSHFTTTVLLLYHCFTALLLKYCLLYLLGEERKASRSRL